MQFQLITARWFHTKFALAATIICLGFASVANAQAFTGSFAAVPNPLATPTSSFTSSSVALNAQNLITTGLTGSFAATVPGLSDLTAYSTTITGLSSTPLADSIPNFFVFASPDSTFGGAGTTPANRFHFDLATIAQSSSGVFNGTGTVADTQAVFTSTPAIFTLSFSSASNYSFTFAAVPEPTTCGLAGIGLLGALGVRRRRAI